MKQNILALPSWIASHHFFLGGSTSTHGNPLNACSKVYWIYLLCLAGLLHFQIKWIFFSSRTREDCMSHWFLNKQRNRTKFGLSFLSIFFGLFLYAESRNSANWWDLIFQFLWNQCMGPSLKTLSQSTILLAFFHQVIFHLALNFCIFQSIFVYIHFLP